MKRLDREWLLGPIWGVLGYGALLGAQGCGGEAASAGGTLPERAAPEGSAGGVSPSGAGEAPGGVGGVGNVPVLVEGTSASGGMGGSAATATPGTGGSAGSELAAGIWQFTFEDEPSAEPPVPVACLGIDGAMPNDSDAQFYLTASSAIAFCGPSFPRFDDARGVCLPAPPPGQTCESAYAPIDVASIWRCGYTQLADYVCGPQLAAPGGLGCGGGECCYTIQGSCRIGRPFTVEGQARQAHLVRDGHWLRSPPLDPTPDMTTLDPDTRRALGDAHAKDALTEHASVAAFARFVLECLALGAPVDIVLAAQRALADEIEHATASFALASAYGGAALGPSGLDVSHALPERVTLVDCVRRTFREGCVAETVSAALIHAAAGAASDAGVKSMLVRTAEDERRHAVLAWRFVSWAVEREGELLRALIVDEMHRAHEHIGFGALTELPGDTAQLRAHGYLDEAERRRVAMQVLEQVVLPSAALLARGPLDDARGRAAPRYADMGRPA